jgi:riboflavin biosynthesis pyrimidine reductase
VSPRALARRLAQAGCFEVLLESGPTLGTAWLKAGLVGRIALFTASRVLGAEGLAWCGRLGDHGLAGALSGRFRACHGVGGDTFAMVELRGRGR